MPQATNILRIGYQLQEYAIEAVLGAGGFGVTYKARDTHLKTWVAIKEYFPVDWSHRGSDGISVYPNTQGQRLKSESGIADYQWGLERFLDEAQALAAIKHPHVVRVHRYFRANGTAYIVMEYEEGLPLSVLLASQEILPEAGLQQLLRTVLPALRAVHERGYLHRDIKPGNLYLRTRDQCMMLIDFGAAREMLSRHSRSITSIVTPGYSPPEQYVVRQGYAYGPWTDMYALGAVMYRCISGATPLAAAERLLGETLQPAITIGAGRYSPELLSAIDRTLALRPEDRYQNVAELQAALNHQIPFPDPVTSTTVVDGSAATVKLSSPLSIAPIANDPTPTTRSRWIWSAAALGLLLTASFIGYSLTTMPGAEESRPPRYQFYEQLKTEQENQAVPTEADSTKITLISQPMSDLATTAIEPAGETPVEDIGEAAQAPDSDALANEELVGIDQSESEQLADSAEDIDRLLTAAQDSLTAYRLTTPRERSAFHYYQRILALDPDNPDAHQGLSQITTRYVQLTRRAISRSDYSKARRYAKAGLTVDPEHPELLTLQSRAQVAPPRPARSRPSRSTLSGGRQEPSRAVGFNDK
ncbi:MAG: protein kinase [Candidatus Competibacteraceae bacterium]|jgi:serine/threonine protein kinase|nr:protein kinase [Candidatus Competibacteraceae bacterium]